jgi:methyltransferase of ATP-grasp peptide maturase system
VNAPGAGAADTDRARYLRCRLADRLPGQERAESWRDMFRRVPRHVFVPRFFLDRQRNGRYESIEVSNPGQYEEWLAAVYSDEVLITQLDGTDDTWVPEGKPTSSSTMPSLMMLMLDALDIRDGMNVLEIGTGTGYNAALLCEKLGSAKVTSIDIDVALVKLARQRLASLGYAPAVEALDGSHGYEPNAPYDRILATVALPYIPQVWVRQTRDNGLILVNLYRDLGAGALILLTVHGGRAEGNFLSGFGGFMSTRATCAPDVLELLQAAKGEQGYSRPATLDGHILDDPAFGLLAALRISASRIESQTGDQPAKFWLIGRDGSWAYQTTDPAGQRVAVQSGARRLWDEVEKIHDEWVTLGQPPRGDFGLTVTGDGRHLLWCKHPGNPIWEIIPDQDP